MTNPNQEPLVSILMGTFNGERFIREQLDSIAAQTHKNWKIVISDDGSTDRTIEIARQWAKEVGEGRVEFREGPRRGYAQNFLSMACDTNLRADFYAFCDQDDIWIKNKLEVALTHLRQTELMNQPSLYCGRTRYVNNQLEKLGYSTLFSKPPSFENALVQSLAGGNTMVFDQLIKDALEKSGVVPAISHDWWLYQLTCGMEGHVCYDLETFVLYRQHQNAQIGGDTSFLPRMKRRRIALRGEFRGYTDQTIACLEQASNLLHETNKKTLDMFKYFRSAKFLMRLFGFYRIGLYRQTFVDHLGLLALWVLKKV